MAKPVNRRKRHEKAAAFLQRNKGNEPIIDENRYVFSLADALNWYHVNTEEKDLRKYAEQYLKANGMKDFLYSVQKATFYEIRHLGMLGRLISRDQFIKFEDVERILLQLNELKERYKKPTAKVAERVSVQDRILEQARLMAGLVEEELDAFMVKQKSDFSMTDFLATNEISTAVAKRIGEMYKSLAKELQDAVSGKDEQLVEGYSNFSKAGLKRYSTLVQSIVDACHQKAVSVVRKPRARKPKPPAKIVAKLKYMKEYPELKLKSVDPTKIVGASELWVYNPEKRKLAVFRAQFTELTVKGTSIVNFDVQTSEMKTIRDPESFFKGLQSTGKRAMANAWKEIRAKQSKPKARLNDDWLLLACN